MRILTRYILRAHVAPFLFALCALTGILLVNSVARQLESLAGKGLPASVFVGVVLYSTPSILAQVIPMAVLVAVLHTFTQLSADNELTALKASGVSLHRLLLPVLAAGTLVAAGMVGFYDRVLPEANHRLVTLWIDVARKSPTLKLQEQVINPIENAQRGTRYYLQAATIEAGNRMRDVVIYDLSDPGRSRTVYADSGRLAFNRQRTDLLLDLHAGWVNEADVMRPEQFRRLFFAHYLLRVPGVDNAFQRGANPYRGDRELTLAGLRQRGDSLAREVARLRVEARRVRQAEKGTTPSFQQQALRNQLTGKQDELGSVAVEYHKKFALPFACIVFVLIGLPLALRFPRGGVGAVLAVSLAIFSVYYVGLMGGETLAERGYLSPFLAMWAANLLFLALSVVGVATLGRERASARDGGWADLLPAALRRRARARA